MSLREFSGGDRLSSGRQEVLFKECVSAARLFASTVFVLFKRNPFLAIIPAFVRAKAEREGGGYTQV